MRCASCQTKFRIQDPNQLKGPELANNVYDLVEPVAPKVEKSVPPVIGGPTETTKVRPPVIGAPKQAMPPGLPGGSSVRMGQRDDSGLVSDKSKVDVKRHSYAAKAMGVEREDQDQADGETTWRPSVLTVGLLLFFMVFSITTVMLVRSEVKRGDGDTAQNRVADGTNLEVAAKVKEADEIAKVEDDVKSGSSKENLLPDSAMLEKPEARLERNKAEVAAISKKEIETKKTGTQLKALTGNHLKATSDSELKEAVNFILGSYRPGILTRSLEQKVYNQALVESIEGDKWSEAIAGICEIKGIGTIRNVGSGEKRIKAAAQSGETMAINQIALMYFLGNGLEENEAEARKWYQVGAGKGDIESKAWLGYLLCEGFGGDADLKSGKKMLIETVDKNYPLGMYFLAMAYLKGTDASETKQVVPLLTKSSELGHGLSKKLLSDIYLFGRTVEKDKRMAITLLKELAEEGNIQAMRELGYILGFGSDEIKKDIQESKKWLEKAASNGDVTSNVYLGLMTRREGKYDEAIRYLKRAEEQGDLNAAGIIGETLLKTARDQNQITVALESLNKAAAKGSDEATFQLALYYAYGKKIESGLGRDEVIGINPSMAFKLCQTAAERNHINAMQLLADLYYDGIGTTRNKAIAQKWRTAAAKARNELNR